MRRTAALVTVALALLAATAGTSTAETLVKTQDQPSSTWAQPGTAPLDALGAFLYVVAPPPKATQGSLFGYEYTLSYRLEDGTLGLVVVGYQNGRKVAGFGIITGQPVAAVPYDWQFGRPYFLYTKRFDDTRYAAWIQDSWTGAVTFIGLEAAPPGAGGIRPGSATTAVDYDATLAPSPTADASTCAFYPEVDAFFFAPIGWRGAAASLATRSGNTVQKGDCPSTTSSIWLWQYYRLGTTAA